MLVSRFCVCIPTYKRPRLLERVVREIAKQNRLPDALIVVDGFPEDGETRKKLENNGKSLPFPVFYCPSNHANLPYQRWLGARWAGAGGYDTIVYFDDDMLLESQDLLLRLTEPFRDNSDVVALTARINQVAGEHQGPRFLDERRAAKAGAPGSGARVGTLSLLGDIREPVWGDEDRAGVEFLRGGVMAIRCDVLGSGVFHEDLFSLAERGWGTGEDKYLGICLLRFGNILMLKNAGVSHPCDAMPSSYPSTPVRYGFAYAYSRRLLADARRKPASRLFIALLSRTAAFFLKGFCEFRLDLLKVGFGFGIGSLAAVAWPPRAKRLCPGVDWASDASQAVKAAARIGETA